MFAQIVFILASNSAGSASSEGVASRRAPRGAAMAGRALRTTSSITAKTKLRTSRVKMSLWPSMTVSSVLRKYSG